MRIISLSQLLFLFQILAVPTWAGDIKEVDYPIQYEVMSTGKADKLKVEKVCSMTLRDRANTNVTLNVSRQSYGSCHILDSGKVYRGRKNERKNEIELVIPVGEDKARVEDWQIIGIVNINPR
jgi:hypothetical protein